MTIVSSGFRTLLCTFALVALISQTSEGASRLIFPRLSAEAGSVTGIAIFNPNVNAAPVDLTAYGADGSVLKVERVEVGGGRQLALVTGDLFADVLAPNSVAWLEADSSADDLTGFFLFLSQGGAEFDGANPPTAATTVVFDLIRVGSDLSTELNLVNPNPAPASVTLRLIGSGNPVERTMQIAARGVARLDAADFFGLQSTPLEAYVVCESEQEIAGFEFVRSSGADLLGLNAFDDSQLLDTLFFPQMAVLGGFESRIGVVNRSDQPVILTIRARRPDGSLFVEGVQSNPVTRGLDPGKALNEDLAALFGFQGSEVREGWLEVQASRAAVQGFLSYRVPAAGAAAAVPALARGNTAAVFSHLATSLGFFTGLAVLNPAEAAANLRIVAQSAAGETLGAHETVLLPGQRISASITELIPEAADQAGGLIFVRSNFPVFLSALFGTDQGNVLANIPPQSAPGDFRPDQELPSIRVVPPLAVVETGETKLFRVDGPAGDYVWSVNGVEGGNVASGLISATGLYRTPLQPPARLPIAISASQGALSAASSVDLLTPEALVANLGIVRSVAYLSTLQRLYSAELLAPSAALAPAASNPQQLEVSQIFDVSPPSGRTLVAQFQGEDIAQIIPFTTRNGIDHLLLAGQTSGTVIRVNPVTKASRVVVRELDQPSTLFFDTIGENLLIAEATQVTSVPRRVLESDLLAPEDETSAPLFGKESDGQSPRTALMQVEGVGGFEVDLCTGDLYLAEPARGRILRFRRGSVESEVVAENFVRPTRLLGLYRRGMTCPQAFHLLVVEANLNRLSLVIPSLEQIISPWVRVASPTDLAFISGNRETLRNGSLVYNENSQSGQTLASRISAIDIQQLYDLRPINPPVLSQQ